MAEQSTMIDTTDDFEEPQKPALAGKGVRRGVKSGSRVYPRLKSQGSIPFGTQIDDNRETFTIEARSGAATNEIEIGGETFKVGGQTRYTAPLHYSLNKKKRWELVDELGEYEEVEEEVVEKHSARRARAMAMDAATSAAADAADRKSAKKRLSKFHVYRGVADVTTTTQRRHARGRFEAAAVDEESEKPVLVPVKTRKGTKMVRKWPEGSERTDDPPSEELMEAKYFVTVTVQPAKGQKIPHPHIPHPEWQWNHWGRRRVDNGLPSHRAHKWTTKDGDLQEIRR